MISVLVPTSGRPAMFRDMLESLQATTQGHEIEVCAVIDDDKEALDVATKYGTRIDYSPVRRGALWSWNRALEMSLGDILVPAGDDQIFHPDWLPLNRKSTSFSICEYLVVFFHPLIFFVIVCSIHRTFTVCRVKMFYLTTLIPIEPAKHLCLIIPLTIYTIVVVHRRSKDSAHHIFTIFSVKNPHGCKLCVAVVCQVVHANMAHGSHTWNEESSWWVYDMLVQNRSDFLRSMKDRNIPASVVHVGIDKHPLFGVSGELSNQRYWDEHHVCLPCHSSMSWEDVERVVEAVNVGW